MSREDHHSSYRPVRGRNQTISYVDCNGKVIYISNLAFTTSPQPEKTAKTALSSVQDLKQTSKGATQASYTGPSRTPRTDQINYHKASKLPERPYSKPPGTIKDHAAFRYANMSDLIIKTRAQQGRDDYVWSVSDMDESICEPLFHQAREEVHRDAELRSSAFEHPRKAPQPPASPSSAQHCGEQRARTWAAKEDAKARGRDSHEGDKKLGKKRKSGFFCRLSK